MLDMGFKPAVSRIVGLTPERRQTLFFSATLEGATGKIATAFTRDARRHTQEKDKRETADIEHRFLHVDSQSAKLDHLVAQLRGAEGSSTLVFVRTKRGADRLVEAASQPRARDRGDARRQEPAPARTGARPVRRR